MREPFLRLRLSGGRYTDAGLPVAATAELTRYERLLRAVAHAVYFSRNPKRLRVPRGFDDALDLRLADIEEGSVVPVLDRLERESSSRIEDEHVDYFDEARRLINEALAMFDGETISVARLPAGFPASVRRELAHLGRSLRSDEQLELTAPGVVSGRVDERVRRRIQVAAEMDSIEVERVIIGQITGLRSDPMQFDLRLGERTLTGKYRDPETHDDLRTFQGFVGRAPLAALSVVAREDLDGSLLEIIDVSRVEAALPESWRQRIAQLGRLKRGWLDGEADAPSRAALDRAEDLLLACVDEGVDRPGIYPLTEGGVRLEWPSQDGGVELDLPNTGGYELFWYGRAADSEGERFFDEDERDDLLDEVKGRTSVARA